MLQASGYDSAWRVVDAVDKSLCMLFNVNDAEFPSRDEQDEVTKGFGAMSAAGFHNICHAVYGILI
jgi:hypothetical protein